MQVCPIKKKFLFEFYTECEEYLLHKFINAYGNFVFNFCNRCFHWNIHKPDDFSFIENVITIFNRRMKSLKKKFAFPQFALFSTFYFDDQLFSFTLLIPLLMRIPFYRYYIGLLGAHFFFNCFSCAYILFHSSVA